jgi:soluble lytic murein transglycosylase
MLALAGSLPVKPLEGQTSTHHKTTTTRKTSKSTKKRTATTHKPAARAHRKTSTTRRKPQARTRTHRHRSVPTARSRSLRRAFVASSQLRPMAQQLTAMRTPAAYAGVLNYARSHTGEASAAAYLALGHAYLLDRRYAEAAHSFHTALERGKALDDYAEYLEAQADLQGGNGAQADTLLQGFAKRHPDSIFTEGIPVLLASAYLQQQNQQAALQVLLPLRNQMIGGHSDFLYILGRAYQLSGDTAQATAVYRRLYDSFPLSGEAQKAVDQLQQMGAAPLTASERRRHADSLFAAGRYGDAVNDYDALARMVSAGSPDWADFQIRAAACRLKLKKLSRRDAEKLPDVDGEPGALRLYVLAELARNDNDASRQQAILRQMVQRFPASPWLGQALYSGGNMYLLSRDYPKAIDQYSTLFRLFPRSRLAPSSHWRAAWLNYRLRNYSEAARLMDEQLQMYAGGAEIPNALYWRGRIYEEEEHNIGQAENYYRVLAATFRNYYYAMLARQRLSVLPPRQAQPVALLATVKPPVAPDLSADLPEDDIHLIKARLLANAALNEYIAPEIEASEDSSSWGDYAQAEIYASYGEYFRALQVMKRSSVPFLQLTVDQVPMAYWKLLFPRPYWADLNADASRNGLDPYLVASLVRQESEFNPGAVSHANAYGLMQLLPVVGKKLARREGNRRFTAAQLLNPVTNLRLGTVYLSSVIGSFDGQMEYALAAYNAGNSRVREWLAAGGYKDIPEFVESIPFSETRGYVESILRNREMYRQVYGPR